MSHGIVSSARLSRVVAPTLRNLTNDVVTQQPQGEVIVSESLFAFEIGTICGLITGCLNGLFTRRSGSVTPLVMANPDPLEEAPEISRIHEGILAEANIRTARIVGHDPRILELPTTGMVNAHRNNSQLENLNTISEKTDINAGLLNSDHRSVRPLEERRLGIESTFDELLTNESVRVNVGAALTRDPKIQTDTIGNLFSGMVD
jgi:hypothetical protein